MDQQQSRPQPTALRPPLPHRPAVRKEGPSDQSDKRRDKKDCIPTNPNVDIAKAYRRRSLKHRIECGHRVKVGPKEVEQLRQQLGTRKCQMYSENDAITNCVICEDQCVDGEFAVETVLFIPNKNNAAYEHLGRFRVELPRIACHQCAKEHATENGINAPKDQVCLPLGAVWKKYQNNGLSANTAPTVNSAKSTQSTKSTNSQGVDPEDQKESIGGQMGPPRGLTGFQAHNPGQQHNPHNQLNQHNQHNQHSHHHHGHAHHQQQGHSAKLPMPIHEPERDPFDDGFLICTQLVKTGGADQGGLQVGDVFVEFGHYCLRRFPGLKAIANLVRRSAGKEIAVVVWRKLEQQSGNLEDDGTGRTVFQKLALKLKPLQSHDADGGGVLGAVINTYPLPEMKN